MLGGSCAGSVASAWRWPSGPCQWPYPLVVVECTWMPRGWNILGGERHCTHSGQQRIQLSAGWLTQIPDSEPHVNPRLRMTNSESCWADSESGLGLLTLDLIRDRNWIRGGQTHPYIPKSWVNLVKGYVSKEKHKGWKISTDVEACWRYCLMFLRIYRDLKSVSSKNFLAQSQISLF